MKVLPVELLRYFYFVSENPSLPGLKNTSQRAPPTAWASPSALVFARSLACALSGQRAAGQILPAAPRGSAGAGEASRCRCPCDLVSSRFSQSSSLTFGGGKDRGRSSPVTPRLRRSCRRKHLPTPLLSFRRSRARLSPLGASGAFFLLL